MVMQLGEYKPSQIIRLGFNIYTFRTYDLTIFYTVMITMADDGYYYNNSGYDDYEFEDYNFGLNDHTNNNILEITKIMEMITQIMGVITEITEITGVTREITGMDTQIMGVIMQVRGVITEITEIKGVIEEITE